MVFSAEEAVFSQRKFVPGNELLFTGHASKAFRVKDFILGPHHKIVLAKRPKTFVAFRPKQSEIKIEMTSRFQRSIEKILPDIVFFAVGLSISHKTGTVFIKEHLAFATLEAGCVPFEVGRYPEDVLVMNLPTTANTK